MIEIELKFLVEGNDFIPLATKSEQIKQGYICSDPNRTVRVRTKGQKGYLTIKGASTPDGTSRYEFEKEIAYSEALELLELCEGYFIEKTRYLVPFENQLFEVDIFEGKNKGLILAEIELDSVSQKVKLPPWLGKEVTGDQRYYNAYLSQVPYQEWS